MGPAVLKRQLYDQGHHGSLPPEAAATAETCTPAHANGVIPLNGADLSTRRDSHSSPYTGHLSNRSLRRIRSVHTWVNHPDIASVREHDRSRGHYTITLKHPADFINGVSRQPCSLPEGTSWTYRGHGLIDHSVPAGTALDANPENPAASDDTSCSQGEDFTCSYSGTRCSSPRDLTLVRYYLDGEPMCAEKLPLSEGLRRWKSAAPVDWS